MHIVGVYRGYLGGCRVSFQLGLRLPVIPELENGLITLILCLPN